MKSNKFKGKIYDVVSETTTGEPIRGRVPCDRIGEKVETKYSGLCEIVSYGYTENGKKYFEVRFEDTGNKV